MTFSLDLGDETIDLGNALDAFAAFAEIAGTVGTDPDYDELQSVPGFSEAVTDWWLGQARAQAALFLDRHGADVSDPCRDVLRALIGEAGSAGRARGRLRSSAARGRTRSCRGEGSPGPESSGCSRPARPGSPRAGGT